MENYTGSKTVDSLKEYVRTMKHKQTEGKTAKKKKTETPSKGPAKKKSSKSILSDHSKSTAVPAAFMLILMIT